MTEQPETEPTFDAWADRIEAILERTAVSLEGIAAILQCEHTANYDHDQIGPHRRDAEEIEIP